MRTTLWLVPVVAAAAVAFSLGVSCAIDDEVVWISGERCTGSCTGDGLAPGASCDTDTSCTPGCPEDWDCAPVDGPDAGGVDASFGDEGTREDTVDDIDIGESDGEMPPSCIPDGGADSDTADLLVIGGGARTLRACADPSAWFAFDATAGTRFAIELSLAEGSLGVRLYAGDGIIALLQHSVSAGAATLEATAGRTGRYFLRVRAELGSPLPYRLAVRDAAQPRPE